MRKAVMFGFRKEDPDETGYLAMGTGNDLYRIVQDRNEAKLFDIDNVEKIKGFGTPEQWCEFFNTDDELSAWKFHVVKLNLKEKDL